MDSQVLPQVLRAVEMTHNPMSNPLERKNAQDVRLITITHSVFLFFSTPIPFPSTMTVVTICYFESCQYQLTHSHSLYPPVMKTVFGEFQSVQCHQSRCLRHSHDRQGEQ